MAELLAVYSGRPEIELVALNGEDYCAFIMNQRPALALTSESIFELMADIVHTGRSGRPPNG